MTGFTKGNVTPIDEDIFATPPSAAQAEITGPGAAAKAYVDLINAHRFAEIGNLFADDAIFLAPNGDILRGKHAIGKFYADVLSTMRPHSIPLSFITDGSECVMELASRWSNNDDHYRLVAIDHFTVDDSGKITRLVVFVRPQVMSVVTSDKT